MRFFIYSYFSVEKSFKLFTISKVWIFKITMCTFVIVDIFEVCSHKFLKNFNSKVIQQE